MIIWFLLHYLTQKFKLFLVFGFIFLSTYLNAVFFEESFFLYTQEDGIVENAGAIFFLIASVLLFVAFGKAHRATKTTIKKSRWRNYWLLMLALFFLIALGEETSWGQRLFDFKTPEPIRELNVQGEFNLHNLEIVHGRDWDGELKKGFLSWFNSHRLFYGLLLFYLLLMPLSVLSSNRVSKLIHYLGIPIPSLWIGIVLLLAILLAKANQMLFAYQNQKLYHSLVEIMETNIALVAALLGYSLLRKPNGYELQSE